MVTLEQFTEKLPQNHNTLSQNGTAAAGIEANNDLVGSVDLRGLGVGTTLILLNGRRLAIGGSSGRTPDLSLIPLSAVERVEILSDGASAIYGSDAIGGVVNVILRRDYDGAETALSNGITTHGSHTETRADQSFGKRWDSGGFLASYSFYDQNRLDASERDFSKMTPSPFTLMPFDKRNSGIFTFDQQTSGGTRISGDSLLSTRDTYTTNKIGSTTGNSEYQERAVFGDVSLQHNLSESLAATLASSYSTLDLTNHLVDISSAGPSPTAGTIKSSDWDINAKIDGDLFSLPASAAKFSLGGGFSRDGYEIAKLSASRKTRYAFGELLLPLVTQSMGVTAVNYLELSLAGRYTDYSDFGHKTNPKVGLAWRPVPSVKLRGTWSTSFRAPSFLEQYSSGGFNYLFKVTSFGFPDIWTSNNSAEELAVFGGGNPQLTTESANVHTFGIDLTPESAPNLKISSTYFSINYTDRVALGDPTFGQDSFANPQNFPSLYILHPSPAYVASLIANTQNFYNDTGIDFNAPGASRQIANVTTVVLDDRYRNLARSKVSGLDGNVAYGIDSRVGHVRVGAEATYILNADNQIEPGSPIISQVGTVLHPPHFKGRTFLQVAHGAFSSQINVNVVGSYRNPYSTARPNVSSWTTLDLTTAYDVPAKSNSLFGGMRISIDVSNLMNTDPPFVAQAGANQTINAPIGFDPANANPRGRFIALTLQKRWGRH